MKTKNLNFVEAVEAMEEGGIVKIERKNNYGLKYRVYKRTIQCFSNASTGWYDSENSALVMAKETYEIVEKKTLSDKAERFKGEKFVTDVCNKINPPHIRTEFTTVAKEIFGEKLL